MLAGISEGNADPLLSAPDRTTMPTRGIAADMKIESRRNTEGARDLKACPAAGDIAYNAADPAGTIELNRRRFEHFMPLTFPVLAHGVLLSAPLRMSRPGSHIAGRDIFLER
jgi:hypothetical protein